MAPTLIALLGLTRMPTRSGLLNDTVSLYYLRRCYVDDPFLLPTNDDALPRVPDTYQLSLSLDLQVNRRQSGLLNDAFSLNLNLRLRILSALDLSGFKLM